MHARFRVDDVLPFVSVLAGQEPVALEHLAMSVVVSGLFAETTQTLTLRNPNQRVLEGSLTFPLPEGAVITGYAIDIDGALVDARAVIHDLRQGRP